MNINDTNKIANSNLYQQELIKKGKVPANSIYIVTDDLKWERIELLDLFHNGVQIKSYLADLINTKYEHDILLNRVNDTEHKHGCRLEDLKTKESHIPLVLEKNNAGYITRATINYNTAFLNDKSEIPKDINTGRYKEVNGEFIEDKNKTLMYKEVI